MSAADEAEIKHIFVDVLPSMVRAENIPGYLSLVTDDATWCPPNAPNRTGKPAIAEGLKNLFAVEHIDPTFQANDVKVIGDFGYVFGTSAEKITPVDGSPTSMVYTGELWHFRKVAGSWLIELVVFNPKPAPS
jgi:ketosteroid isomerase-like protein